MEQLFAVTVNITCVKCKCKGTVPLFYEFTGLDGKNSRDITQEGLKCGMMKEQKLSRVQFEGSCCCVPKPKRENSHHGWASVLLHNIHFIMDK